MVPVLLTVVLGILGVVALMFFGMMAVGASELHQTKRLERAASRDWTKQDSDPTLATAFSGGPFGVGRDHEATDVYRGEHGGRPFVAFSLSLTDDTGDREEVHRYSVVAVEHGPAVQPVSVLRTESPVPLFEEVDGEDVVIERAAFPRLYRVRTPAPELARALLHPAAIDAVLGLPAVAWRLADGWLLAISKVSLTPLQIRYELEVLQTMLDAVPPELWERHHA